MRYIISIDFLWGHGDLGMLLERMWRDCSDRLTELLILGKDLD
ncbi:hypothetical protein ANAPH1_00862 [Anaplasma phagocytophilum]|nr:hypothetical protein [Anaplasma phagocytophilum]SCV65670.1 hypothetical protein ANAPH1_00862 [Anaplasma phagocytophilum]